MADNTADSVINAIIRFAWPIAAITTLTTAAILFWPSGAALFKLNSLPKWMLDYSGLVFLVSASSLICLVGNRIWQVAKDRSEIAEYKEGIVQILSTLSWEEKAILREFFLSGADVLNMPYQYPTVIGLRNKHILALATSSAVVYGLEMEFPHQLPPRIKQMIQPDMIDLSKAYRLANTNQGEFQQFRPPFRRPRNDYY
jgi:hypothetical protein